jgi:hypothetical protein
MTSKFRPKNSEILAWRNEDGTPDEWVRDAAAQEIIAFDVPEKGQIKVQSEYLGEHVCEPGQWLCKSEDGHIMACADEAFQQSYEPSGT